MTQHDHDQFDPECEACRNGIEDTIRQMRDIIVRVGWVVVPVIGENFAYTIGLSLEGLPELMLVGPFRHADAQAMLNTAASKMEKAKPYRDMVESFVVHPKYPVTFREIEQASFRQHTAMLSNVLGEQPDQRMLHMVLCDTKKRFPWEDGYDWIDQEHLHLTYKSPSHLH